MKSVPHTLVSKHKRKVAMLLLVTMTAELLMPVRALALTSGPSQPEFQGFTPLATTSLVDPFSGDFSYNIPLLEIDGYPLNLVYRATSNVEEEGSWVGYGWNVNVGTLNRMVRGLPDDMNGDVIKSYQNIRERTVESTTLGVDATFGFNAGEGGKLGVSAGIQGNVSMTFDEDNYIGKGIGVSVGGGVYANVSFGPVGVGANAGVTLTANSNSGGTITPYAGFSITGTVNSYVSGGLGVSVDRTYNTINGWERPNIIGSYNIGHVGHELARNFISSISNSIPAVTAPYCTHTDGLGFKLTIGAAIEVVEKIGLDLGIGLTYSKNHSSTKYESNGVRKGYGYMYAENAEHTDMMDFTRDNDGGINKDMPFMPPAMKTYDVFNSTAHNASGVFRADRNDFGTVRDPQIEFVSAEGRNRFHKVDIKALIRLTCIGAEVKYENIRTTTESSVASGGCPEDAVRHRKSNGRDQNLFFKSCGTISQADEGYLSQVGGTAQYAFNKADSIRGSSVRKRVANKEPIAVYTNEMIAQLPQTVIAKQLASYPKNDFPATTISTINRPSSTNAENSRIGAILNTNSAGQTFVYATPVQNNIKSEVAFRVDGFDPGNYQREDGLMSFKSPNDSAQFNGLARDRLYKSTFTPAYATSYLLNAVLSPDYVDVKTDGISDDDLGGFVKFNYSRTETDYRWRAPYGDRGQNKALLNEGVKLTKFDDMGSYVIGSKEVWYAHSIESKNYIAEFYLSERADAKDSRSKIMRPGHPYAIPDYASDKTTFSRLQKLDCIRYYSKHDRLLNGSAAVPLKTIYFDYDYKISSGVSNSDSSGKLRLVKLRVQHGSEPLEYAETYDLDYSLENPSYALGTKDGWGNYYRNNRLTPLCEAPYIDQADGSLNRNDKNAIASAFHLTSITLPSGGKIDVEYEADDYAWVQDRRAMALTEVAGVGNSPALVPYDAYGLYDHSLNPFLYIYVKKPVGLSGNYKSFLLNNSSLMYFSFNINIGGNAFTEFDQVKGYAEVENIGQCSNDANYLYIKVKPASLTGTNVKPSPMTNTAINMARAFASDQLYFQEREISTGHAQHQLARLTKAALQLADAVLGKNSIKELMNDYRAGHRFVKGKSFVRLAMTQPKIGGGSRVSKLTFGDEWNEMSGSETSTLVGYRYYYKDLDGLSSGVASYEPTLGGEENPLRSGHSYGLTNNSSKYPPYDPIELLKEDPAGESFFPTGAVGYSRVVTESIHRDKARSAQSRMVQEFYTTRDFPWISAPGPKTVEEEKSKDYPDRSWRDIALSFLGFANTFSASANRYKIQQSFVIETNDMHGKPKGSYNYRLLQRNNGQELVSSTEYFYHTNGGQRLSNEVDVIQHVALPTDRRCNNWAAPFPKANIQVARKTVGVDVDVCTDSREVVSTETRHIANRGGGLKGCVIPVPSIIPSVTWTDNTHDHTDYFKSTVTTKIVNRYGILKSVRNVKEGAETVVLNKYFDALTGEAVVQVVKDKFGDDLYTTTIPAYWTKTDLEPSYLDYPYYGTGTGGETILPSSLTFDTVGNGNLQNTGLLRSSFFTTEDLFHQGDELFVRATSSDQPNYPGDLKWHRLYVADVLVKKNHWLAPDPLAYRYGSSQSTGVQYQVFVMPYKVSGLVSADLGIGEKLENIEGMFKYRSGRKNMLSLTAGNFVTTTDPFVYPDSIDNNGCNRKQGDSGSIPNFRKYAVDASANRYSAVNAVVTGSMRALMYNPVSLGVFNQPFVDSTYMLIGERQAQNGATLQRGNGLLPNWYYWLSSRVDSTNAFEARKALLMHFDNSSVNWYAGFGGNAVWQHASNVSKSVPSLGPVEETNALGIYSAIFLEPLTRQVLHATANGRFGQTWVETFEDMQRVRQYNERSDLIFSPFQHYMNKIALAGTVYKRFGSNQNLSNANLTGEFDIDGTQSHSGTSCMSVIQQLTLKVTSKKYGGTGAYFHNLFDFNLDAATGQKYTYEVWVKANGGGTPVAPSIKADSATIPLAKVSNVIDGWVLHRSTVAINNNSQVTFTFPANQRYDDLRVAPAGANVKAYVYHPFRNYLMAILDENNNATFYEYNTRNQLVRMKKETEKGILTVTENIKNVITKQ